MPRQFSFADLKHMEGLQADHPCLGRIRVEANKERTRFWVLAQGAPDHTAIERSLDDVVQTFVQRDLRIKLAETDRHNYGFIFPTWDENLWEMCRQRVEIPGEVANFLVSGGNGAAKSEFAGWVVSRILTQANRKPLLFLTDDEPKSKKVQQQKVYVWLPEKYHNERGRLSTTANTKFGWNGADGFTENGFCINGSVGSFRFWSALVTSMEGLRPYFVWSDEEIPLDWLEAARRRLITEAEGSKKFITEWRGLLEQKKANPQLQFPHNRIGDLMCGFHLITWTPSQGRTQTVCRFQDKGTVRQEIEADKVLLPRMDKEGETLVGGEKMPRLIYGRDPEYRTRMMYPWENPMGGNYEAIYKECIKKKSPTYTRWRIYGVAEKGGGSPFNNFSTQMHVIPKSWLPRIGTWYLTVDPTVSGQKTWTMLWSFVSGEHRGFIKPGDIIVVHEYPQCDDFIPGYGFPDEWCQPGGEKGRGIAGAIQHGLTGGFQDKCNEIVRIEKKLGEWIGSDKPIVIPSGNRIIDSRAAETETRDKSESKTLIQWLEDVSPPLYFIPAGRASGAATGMTDISPGEQMINNLFAFDRDNCEIDKETGRLIISPLKGTGPRLWVLENCSNLISAIQSYPGIAAPGAAQHMSKDYIDNLRYLCIADPYHRPPSQQEDGEIGGW
jgi:hypothetical protein